MRKESPKILLVQDFDWIGEGIPLNKIITLNAKVPPTIEPKTPKTPTIKPIFSSWVSFLILVAAAVSAVGIVVSNEIPWAMICSKPPKNISIGILIIPPPIPRRPEPIPDTRPIKK